jgi:hypothetical protein
MKRLLLVVSFSMLLAMWILSAWEIAQAARIARVPSLRPAPIPLVNLDGSHRFSPPALHKAPISREDPIRFEADLLGRPEPTAPIFADPIEQRRLIR